MFVTESLTIDGSTATDVLITADTLGNDVLLPGTFITDIESIGPLVDNSRVLGFAGITGDLSLVSLTLTGGRTSTPVSSGGGIRFTSNGTLTLTSSTVSGNSTSGNSAHGGGIFSSAGSVVISGSTISNNAASLSFDGGGGVYSQGTLDIANSTLSDNSAKRGGAIRNKGTATITSSTISANSAIEAGGGIATTDGTLAVISSTITNNSSSDGGGIHFLPGTASVTLSNSIVANNDGQDLIGDDFSGAYNLIGDGLNLGSLTNTVTGDPRLAPLADNGGSTLTHALLPGSPAIDAGSNPAITILDTSFSAAEGYNTGQLAFQQPNGPGNGRWTLQTIAQVDATAGTVTSVGGPFDRNMWDIGATGGVAGTPSTAGFNAEDALAITFDYEFTLDADANRGLVDVGFRNEGPNAGNGFNSRPQQGARAIYNATTGNVEFFPNRNDQTDPLTVAGSLLGLDTDLADFQSDPLRFEYLARTDGAGNWSVEWFSVENLNTSTVYVYSGPTQTFVYAGDDAFYSQELARSNQAAFTGSALAAAFEYQPADVDQRGTGFDRVKDGNGDGKAIVDIGAFESQAVIPALPGDYNRNGTVDAADYTVWRDTLGQSVAPSSGADGNGDQQVNQVDYDLWAANFGMTLPPPAEAESTVVTATEPAAEASLLNNSPALSPDGVQQLDAGFALLLTPNSSTAAPASVSLEQTTPSESQTDSELLLLLVESIDADQTQGIDANDEALAEEEEAEEATPLAVDLQTRQP